MKKKTHLALFSLFSPSFKKKTKKLKTSKKLFFTQVAIDYNAGFTGAMAYLTMSEDTWEACKARGDVPRPIKKIY